MIDPPAECSQIYYLYRVYNIIVASYTLVPCEYSYYDTVTLPVHFCYFSPPDTYCYEYICCVLTLRRLSKSHLHILVFVCGRAFLRARSEPLVALNASLHTLE